MWNGTIQLVSLVLLAAVAWYAKEASASLVRLRVFLDARDIDHRKDRIDDARAATARAQSIAIWLRDTRAIWGRLFSAAERLRALGEELAAPDRKTVERRADDDAERLSWEALKRQGLIGSAASPNGSTTARVAGTMMSMHAATEPGVAKASPLACPIAAIETKRVCRACDGGFVGVGDGGIRKCGTCDGAGFVDHP